MAQVNLEFAGCFPGEDKLHHIAVAFYMVNPYGRSSWKAIETYTGGRWLSGKELHAGKAEDGRPVNPRLVHLLHRSEAVPAW
jgi:hypothetical protein